MRRVIGFVLLFGGFVSFAWAGTPFTEQAMHDNHTVLEKIKKTPFLTQLQTGTLPPQAFTRFIQRDTAYLTDFKQAMLTIAAKFPGSDPRHDLFLSYAAATQDEQDYLRDNFLTNNPAAPKKPCKPCLAYRQHLLTTSQQQPAAVAVAAILPCFVFFADIGSTLTQHTSLEGHPYALWIGAYSDPGLDELISEITGVANQLAQEHPEQVPAMAKAFAQSADFEYQFFKSAYKD